jgi:ribonuclease J
MTITIYRGIDTIGGCITKISAQGQSVIIDLGHSLGNEADPLANVNAIKDICDGVNGILYTHYHGDHIGLFPYVEGNIPQYIGDVSKQLTIRRLQQLAKINDDQAEERNQQLERFGRFQTFQHGEPFCVPGASGIRITPLRVNHSAADAYMFLIEADGQVVLHTGDFRSHGYFATDYLEQIYQMAGTKAVDVLITEGTTINRQDADKIWSEKKIESVSENIMAKRKYVFYLCSSMDMDRLASIHNANKKMGNRPLVCDDFQKDLMEIFARNYRGEANGIYDFDHYIYSYRPTNEKLAHWMLDKGFTMLVRNTPKFKDWITELLPKLDSLQVIFLYSQFNGYLDAERECYNKDLAEFVSLFGDKVRHLHTSGHATPVALADFCNRVNPRSAIIPIHREAGSDFRNLPLDIHLKSKVVTEATENGDICIYPLAGVQ